MRGVRPIGRHVVRAVDIKRIDSTEKTALVTEQGDASERYRISCVDD